MNGTQILAQTTDGVRTDFRYDGNGKLIAIRYNGTEYYYVTNILGDVISLIDSTGTSVVEYTYDAWGKILSATGTLATTLGQANPFRYRGYYFDTETGFYYLQSRYYDPNTGRFINADDTGILQMTQGELLGGNLYAYCGNCPVNMTDRSGTCPFINGFIDFFLEQWRSLRAIVSDPVGSYLRFVTHPLNWFPAIKLLISQVREVVYLWTCVFKGDISGLAYFFGGRVALGIEMSITMALFKGMSKVLSSVSRKWYKSTFNRVEDSMAYHLKKHGRGRSITQYTYDALEFYNRNRHKAVAVKLNDGSSGYRIQTKINGRNIGGYWTKDGKIVSFWD